jgi:glycosyltransferase involved in cell wall biosynthesis
MKAGGFKVLQATAWYPPYDIGGTEVYLEGLIGELRTLGVDSSVLVPRRRDEVRVPAAYRHAGTAVETYPVNAVPAPNEMREGGPHLHFDEFRTRLKAHRGSIYHQHSWSRGCGPHHLRAARELGLKTVLTVHVAGNICLRGTMLRYGARPCDGRVEERVCGACWAHGRGLPRAAASAVARLPLSFGQRMRRGPTRVATALAARAIGAEQRTQVAEMVHNADRVVAVCQWLYDALAANGAPPDKLVLSRQGIAASFLETQRAAALPRPDTEGPLKLLYVGRWHPIKGIDVIVRALRALPADTSVQLSIHAAGGKQEEDSYEQCVRKLAHGDPRINFAAALARAEVALAMARHDALVVPSVCLETGPLVVLEAQASGLYVMGSPLGGIAELVSNGADGELVQAGSVRAWMAAIARIAERHANGALTVRPRAVRTMAAVADDMAELYQSL